MAERTVCGRLFQREGAQDSVLLVVIIQKLGWEMSVTNVHTEKGRLKRTDAFAFTVNNSNNNNRA